MYIGCIPCKAKEEELFGYFSRFGNIECINLKRRKNGKCCGFGYVICKDKETHGNIIGYKDHFFYERTLLVQEVLCKQKLLEKNHDIDSRRIIIYNLDIRWTEQTLRGYFSQYGAIERSTITKPKKLSSLNYNLESPRFEGKITFAKGRSAVKALKCPV